MVLTLVAIEELGLPADTALEQQLHGWRGDPRDKGLVHEVVAGVVRHRARIDTAAAPLCTSRIEDLDPSTRNAVRAGLYQLFYLDRVPEYAAVSETVAAVGQGAGKLVNAVLREAQRRGRAIFDLPETLTGLSRAAIEHSMPLWILEYVAGFLGEEGAVAFARRALDMPSLTVRVNTRKIARDAFVERARTHGFPEAAPTATSPYGALMARAGESGTPDTWWFLDEGLAAVQDEASQIAAMMVRGRPRERILDYCAAPGGKTTLIAQEMEGTGQIVACDRTFAKRRRIEKLARRMELANVTVHEPAAEGALWPSFGPLAGPPFDAILVDAPCSGLGTLARHPDIKWIKKWDDLERLADVQLGLLKFVWKRLRPGGRLVYSTCTVGPVENDEVVRAFLRSTPEAAILPVTRDEFPFLAPELIDERGCFVSRGDDGGMDGFFAARLVKMAAI